MIDYKTYFSQEDLFFQGYVKKWTQVRWHRLQNNIPWEIDIAAALLATDETLENTIIEFLCARINHTINNDYTYRLFTSSKQPSINNLRYTNPTTGKTCQRTPDMFLVYAPNDEHLNKNDVGNFVLLAAIELKHNAAINYIACPKEIHTGYSNQVICYPNNCWIDTNKITTPIHYIWLAPARKNTLAGLHASGLQPPAPTMRAKWMETASPIAYKPQLHAWNNQWTHINLEDLSNALRKNPDALELANLIDHWNHRHR